MGKVEHPRLIDWGPEKVPAEIQKFLKFARWTFAKTMPNNPHWYVMPQYLATPQDRRLFWRTVDYIEENGYMEAFWWKKYKNIKIGPTHKIWIMPKKKDKDIINCKSRYFPPHVRPSSAYIFPTSERHKDIVKSWEALDPRPKQNIWEYPGRKKIVIPEDAWKDGSVKSKGKDVPMLFAEIEEKDNG